MKHAALRQIVIFFFLLFLIMNPACKTGEPDHVEGNSMEPKVEKSPVEALAFDEVGDRYAMGFGNGTIKLFEFKSGELSANIIINEKYLKYGKYNHILYLDFSPDGKLLASGSEDGFVRIWDVQTGRLVHELAHPYDEEYQKGVFSLAFSPETDLLASAGARYVVIWRTDTGKRVRTLEAGTEYVVDFSADGKVLLTAHWDKMTLWDTVNWEPQEIIKSSGGGYKDISCARFERNGKKLIYVCDDKIFIYNINKHILEQDYGLPDAMKSKYYPYSIFYNSSGEPFLGYLNPWEGLVKIFNLDKRRPVFDIQHLTRDTLIITSADGWVETKPETALAIEDIKKHYRKGLFSLIQGLRTRHTFPGYGGEP
jgi:WD40 repeat protein